MFGKTRLGHCTAQLILPEPLNDFLSVYLHLTPFTTFKYLYGMFQYINFSCQNVMGGGGDGRYVVHSHTI